MSGAVLVTGGNGALGRRLVKALAASGEQVVSFDIAASGISQEASKEIVGDILDSVALAEALQGCRTVVHLAARTDVASSAVEPAAFFDINVRGTVNVVECCRAVGVANVVLASTAHVYGIPRTALVDEAHPVGPLSVYAASKLAAEAAVQGWAAAYGLTPIICRLSNLYGTTPKLDTVVGKALLQAASGGPIALRNLDVARDFLHVDDAASALALLAAGKDRGLSGVFNVCSGDCVTVRKLVRHLIEAVAETRLGRIQALEPEPPSGAEPVPRLALDNRRLVEATGWRAKTSLKEGLGKAVVDLIRNQGNEQNERA